MLETDSYVMGAGDIVGGYHDIYTMIGTDTAVYLLVPFMLHSSGSRCILCHPPYVMQHGWSIMIGTRYDIYVVPWCLWFSVGVTVVFFLLPHIGHLFFAPPASRPQDVRLTKS